MHKARALKNKIINAGGNFIANRLMVQPSIDRMKGEQADKKRQAITSKRARRAAGY